MKNLYMLPFDHRNNFTKVFFGPNVKVEDLTKEQIAVISQAKNLIYRAFVLSIKNGLPKDETAILVDEYFGAEILKESINAGFTTAMCVEKTGQDVFTFEYGSEFREHINTFKPKIIKALIRYNPDNTQINPQQIPSLRLLSDFCKSGGYELLIEPLIIPTRSQFDSVNKDQTRFDKEIRPQLTVKMISELQNNGIEASIWKIEGMYKSADYEQVVKQAKSGNRDDVIVIVLGRAESKDNVETWLREGAKVTGVNGFAVGRTVFMEDLELVIKKAETEEQAINNISYKFVHFYNFFKQNKL